MRNFKFKILLFNKLANIYNKERSFYKKKFFNEIIQEGTLSFKLIKILIKNMRNCKLSFKKKKRKINNKKKN
jgi:hypothetical protein